MRWINSLETKTQELTDEELSIFSGGAAKLEVCVVIGNLAIYLWATKDAHGGVTVLD